MPTHVLDDKPSNKPTNDIINKSIIKDIKLVRNGHETAALVDRCNEKSVFNK